MVIYCATQRNLTADEKTGLLRTYDTLIDSPSRGLKELLEQCDVVAIPSPMDPMYQQIRAIDPEIPIVCPTYESHISGHSANPGRVFLGWERLKM
jgi:hypothetical protein